MAEISKRAVAVLRTAEDPQMLAYALVTRGAVALRSLDLDAAEQACKEALGPTRAAAALAEGSELTLPELIAYGSRGVWPSHLSEADDSPLTPRELEIVGPVAGGLTNQQIATRLGRSTRTVEAHLENARGKLGLNSRSAISAWFARRHSQ
jgi:DNA-binding CsgD family transcriptional regulator